MTLNLHVVVDQCCWSDLLQLVSVLPISRLSRSPRLELIKVVNLDVLAVGFKLQSGKVANTLSDCRAKKQGLNFTGQV